ncbi:MAG: GerMN domain-containing protein [Candidatus Limnocylindria bacterium]
MPRLTVVGALSLLLASCTALAPATPTPTPTATTEPPATASPSPSPTAQLGRCEDARDEGAAAVFVYFSCIDDQPPADVVAASRDAGGASETEDRLQAALEALLEGPTAAERDRGLTSWFSDETAGSLNSVTLSDGTAIVDFADFSEMIPNASTSAGSQMLLAELNSTVFQFDEIDEVEYQFDGGCNAFFEWLQGACTVIDRSVVED